MRLSEEGKKFGSYGGDRKRGSEDLLVGIGELIYKVRPQKVCPHTVGFHVVRLYLACDRVVRGT